MKFRVENATPLCYYTPIDRLGDEFIAWGPPVTTLSQTTRLRQLRDEREEERDEGESGKLTYRYCWVFVVVGRPGGVSGYIRA